MVLESSPMQLIPELTPGSPVISVGDLVRRARELLERNFPLLWVSGEISNLTLAASGHWYFSLKDGSAQVRCVMFRNKNLYLDWAPENGMQVEVRALATMYEARGEFQLNLETMRRAGLGALYEAFEKLKAKLGKDGFFDAGRKRPLPTYPRQIGIITSPAAAALRDVLTTLRRRMPSIPAVLYPTPVQGEGAAQKIAEALRIAGERAECDVLILCRGGGSIEDLWAFNEEIVARAVQASPIPIVCGVGHETDFTIADFVADRRAPTPTAAAEIITPDRSELLHRTATWSARLTHVVQHTLEQRAQQLDYLSRRLTHPGEKLRGQEVHLAHLSERLAQSYGRMLENHTWRISALSSRLNSAKPDLPRKQAELMTLRHRLDRAVGHCMEFHAAALTRLHTHLDHLNPQTVLERGFSIVQHSDGTVISDTHQLKTGDPVQITFAKGHASATVKDLG